MTPNPPDEAFQGGNLRSFSGPRSSSFERLKRFCIFGFGRHRRVLRGGSSAVPAGSSEFQQLRAASNS
eukprot:1334749-Alexandrium_andersonii.AAC.1